MVYDSQDLFDVPTNNIIKQEVATPPKEPEPKVQSNKDSNGKEKKIELAV